jgi:hypothetical protein
LCVNVSPTDQSDTPTAKSPNVTVLSADEVEAKAAKGCSHERRLYSSRTSTHRAGRDRMATSTPSAAETAERQHLAGPPGEDLANFGHR